MASNDMCHASISIQYNEPGSRTRMPRIARKVWNSDRHLLGFFLVGIILRTNQGRTCTRRSNKTTTQLPKQRKHTKSAPCPSGAFNRRISILRRPGNLLRALLRGGDVARALLLLGHLRVDGLGVRLAGDIQVDVLDSAREGLAALKDGEEADANEGAEDPDDAHSDPASEELLAEDVASAVEGHRPEDQERKRLKMIY